MTPLALDCLLNLQKKVWTAGWKKVAKQAGPSFLTIEENLFCFYVVIVHSKSCKEMTENLWCKEM